MGWGGGGGEGQTSLAVVGLLVVVEAHLDNLEHGLGRDGDLIALESLRVRRLGRVRAGERSAKSNVRRVSLRQSRNDKGKGEGDATGRSRIRSAGSRAHGR